MFLKSTINYASIINSRPSEVFGILVPLDFDITDFTSAAYQRSSLLRPSLEI